MAARAQSRADAGNLMSKPASREKEISRTQTIHRTKRRPKPAASEPGILPPWQPDTLLIRKIQQLRANQIEPDINEPLTKDYLFSPVNVTPFPTLIELSRERYFRLQAENDLLDNTDRFYTNGIMLQYVCPAFSGSPLSKIQIPYWHQGINYYGMSLVQNMYTSSKTKEGGILYGDRPYASYLYLSSFKVTNDPARKFRQSSELQIGVIGPASLGGVVQTWFHQTVPTNDKPQGWEYQISNDLLLNYLASYEMGILSMPAAELNLTGCGILGTVYTQLSGGFFFRTGAINPYFKTLGFSKRSINRVTGMRNTQCYLFMRANGTAVGYDATLQGGMFNHDNAYTISSDSISRIKFSGSAGFVFSYGGARIDVEQHFISPEFRGGLWHLWMGVGLTFSF